MSGTNVSGMVSDITIEGGDKVAIFLLLPKAYVKHLDRSFFDVPTSVDCEFPNVRAWGYYDDRNTLHGDYVPFHLPLFGQYEENGSASINDTPELKWLKEFYGFNEKQFFDPCIIEREQVNLPDGFLINKSNIFRYLSVAYEHVEFYKDIIANTPDRRKTARSRNKFGGYSGLSEADNFDDYLTYCHFSGTNVMPYIKDPVSVLSGGADYDGLKAKVLKYGSLMAEPTIDFHMFAVFMYQVNKNFHLSGMARQRIGDDEYRLLLKAQTNVLDSLKVEFDEE